jgi:hypothetical protein
VDHTIFFPHEPKLSPRAARGKRFFPEGKDSKKKPYQDFRWNRFKNMEAWEMYTLISEHVFPWLWTLGGIGSTYSKHMEGARFTIPTPALLAKVVDMIDKVPMEDRDTKGDLYEYMLGKIASAGQNGQFRTPRHIIRLMVEMVEAKPNDVVRRIIHTSTTVTAGLESPGKMQARPRGSGIRATKTSPCLKVPNSGHCEVAKKRSMLNSNACVTR